MIVCSASVCYWGSRSRSRTYGIIMYHNGLDGVSNHQPHKCLLNRLFRHKSKETSRPRVTDLCAGISPVTGEYSAQMASNTVNVSIWWRHHGTHGLLCSVFLVFDLSLHLKMPCRRNELIFLSQSTRIGILGMWNMVCRGFAPKLIAEYSLKFYRINTRFH